MTPDRDKQIMDIFLAAVELPNEQRPGYLNDACREVPELRAEVESLLEHHNPETLISHKSVQGGSNSSKQRPKWKSNILFLASRPFKVVRASKGRSSVDGRLDINPLKSSSRTIAKGLLGRPRFVVISILLAVLFAGLWALSI